MNIAASTFDMSAGCLAGASLCTSRENKTLEMGEFVASATPCPAAPLAPRTKWARFVAAALSPISGPTMPRPASQL